MTFRPGRCPPTRPTRRTIASISASRSRRAAIGAVRTNPAFATNDSSSKSTPRSSALTKGVAARVYDEPADLRTCGPADLRTARLTGQASVLCRTVISTPGDSSTIARGGHGRGRRRPRTGPLRGEDPVAARPARLGPPRRRAPGTLRAVWFRGPHSDHLVDSDTGTVLIRMPGPASRPRRATGRLEPPCSHRPPRQELPAPRNFIVVSGLRVNQRARGWPIIPDGPKSVSGAERGVGDHPVGVAGRIPIPGRRHLQLEDPWCSTFLKTSPLMPVPPADRLGDDRRRAR